MSPGLPFALNNTIRVFRHAVSLDEHRSKYNVVLWQPNDESLTRTDSDVEGVIEMWFAGVHTGTFNPTSLTWTSASSN